jgi:hypothetical protein
MTHSEASSHHDACSKIERCSQCWWNVKDTARQCSKKNKVNATRKTRTVNVPLKQVNYLIYPT